MVLTTSGGTKPAKISASAARMKRLKLSKLSGLIQSKLISSPRASGSKSHAFTTPRSRSTRTTK